MTEFISTLCDEDTFTYDRLESDHSYVWTNFFNNIPDVDFIKNVEEPDYNYDNYTMLSLNSRLSTWIHKNWGENVYITFQGRKKAREQNKLYIIIRPMIGENYLEMTDSMINELQTAFGNINDFKSVLLYSDEQIILDSGIMIPRQWIRELLPYAYINPELNPYVDDLGLFVRIDNYPDFTEIMQKLSINLVEQLETMYMDGYVYNPPSEIIRKWSLNTHNIHKEVYYPSWTDNRITLTSGGKYNFIFDRINGKKTIDYFVGNDNVVKHTLSLMLDTKEITYVGEYARVRVDNLEEAQKIASNVEYAKYIASGIVLIKYVTSMDDVKLYKEIGSVNQNVLKYDSVAVYKSSDIQKPYLVSFLFPYNLHINMRQTSELLWNVFQEYRLSPQITEISEVSYDQIYLERAIPYPEISDDKLENVKYSDGIQYARDMTTLVPHILTEKEINKQIKGVSRIKERDKVTEEVVQTTDLVYPEIILEKKHIPISVSRKGIIP